MSEPIVIDVQDGAPMETDENADNASGGKPAPSTVQLKPITIQRLKKLDVYKTRLQEFTNSSSEQYSKFIQEHADTISAIEQLQNVDVPEKSDNVDLPKDFLGFVALFSEGRASSLSDLLKELHDHFKNKLPKTDFSPLAIRGAVLRVSKRKSFGIRPNKVDENEDVNSDHRWRWEVDQFTQFPAGPVRDHVRRERKLQKKIRELCLAYQKFIRFASASTVDEAKLEKADDAVIKISCAYERLVAQEKEKKRKEAEKIQKQLEREQKLREKQQKLEEAKLEKQRRQEDRDKAQRALQEAKLLKAKRKDFSKERNLMSSWVKTTKVDSTPQKRSPMCGKFLPFEVSTGMKLAPIFPSPRCDPDVIDSMLFSGGDVTSDLKSLNKRRSQRRNRHSGNTLKLFAFYHEYRPACYGTFLQTVSSVNGRRPFVKYSQLDYEVDSDEDWESDVSDAEDVDKSDSEGEEDETGERVDGLEEDGWLQPEEMDADAREQLDQIGGDLNFRYIGPNRIPDLLENPESVDKANVDEEELEVLRQFKVITFDDVLDSVKQLTETPVNKSHGKKKQTKRSSEKPNSKKRKLFSPSTSDGKRAMKQMSLTALLGKKQ